MELPSLRAQRAKYLLSISATHSFSLLPPLAARFCYSLPPAFALLVLFGRVLGQRLWLKFESFPS